MKSRRIPRRPTARRRNGSPQSAEIGTRVAAALGGLSPLERAAFTLRHYEGRSIDEISQTLGLRTSATKHSVFRAVRKLRRRAGGTEMTHYTDDDLILYYYGEGRRRDRADVEHHLESCGECSATYRALAGTLQLIVGTEVPERGEAYPMEVWQRIRARLPEQQAPWWQGWFEWRLVATAAAVAVLVVAAFIAGRLSPLRAPAAPAAVASVDPNEAGARVRLAATGDHLERSERVLLDLVNADGPTVDLTDRAGVGRGPDQLQPSVS